MVQKRKTIHIFKKIFLKKEKCFEIYDKICYTIWSVLYFTKRRSKIMALLEQWQKVAYNEKANKQDLQRFWQRYFLLEKNVYEQLLTNPDEVVE